MVAVHGSMVAGMVAVHGSMVAVHHLHRLSSGLSETAELSTIQTRNNAKTILEEPLIFSRGLRKGANQWSRTTRVVWREAVFLAPNWGTEER